MRTFLVVTVMSLVSFASVGVAVADRPATDAERPAIEAVLRDAGFRSWKAISFDDDDDDDYAWEVDDAVGADGIEYDVYLDRNLTIIRRERD